MRMPRDAGHRRGESRHSCWRWGNVMSVECWDGLITWHKVILTFEINSQINYFASSCGSNIHLL